MLLTRRLLLAGLTVAAAADLVSPAAATPTEGLPQPAEKPILTVSGKIRAFNVESTAKFDRPMLEGLGLSGFTTKTPWYDSAVFFEGVPMKRLVQAVGGYGETVVATALNDYQTTIPIADFTEFDVLLALKRNGQYMPVSDKGPLFIIYPFDSSPALRTQKYYSRSAWQLSALQFT
jgi:hypothetical protein